MISMSFKDIKGQDRAVDILKQHLKHKRLANAYLFSGPEGVGKKLAARMLAKTVNCLEGAIECCDECVSCKKIDRQQHPDVHIIDEADSEIKIEYIRQLQKSINLRPYEAKYKVFIINNAHNLNIASSNAFLKTLEESAGESLIILISDKPALLLKTIISRCQVIKFFPLKRDDVKQILRRDYSVDSNLSHFLAYFYEGRLGSALMRKDSDMLRRKNTVIDEFVNPLKKGFTNLGIEKREDMRSHLNILASWFRDIYMFKAGLSPSEFINLDRKAELERSASRFSLPELDNILNSISDSFLYLERNVNIKLIQSNLKVELWKA